MPTPNNQQQPPPRTDVEGREEGIGRRRNLFEMLAREQQQQKQQRKTTTREKTTTSKTTNQQSKQPKANRTPKLKGNNPRKVLQGQNSIKNYLERNSMETCAPKHFKLGLNSLEIHHQTEKVLSGPGSDFTNSTNGKTTEADNSTDTVSNTAEWRGKQLQFCKDGHNWSE